MTRLMRDIAAMAAVLLLLGLVPAAAQTAAPGTVFRDCPTCPEMVVIPAGSFTMGGQAGTREEPAHQVSFARPFAIARYEVTFEEWDACANDGGCGGVHPKDEGWGRGRQPVINVSWDDANNYVTWLKRKTGKPYRLVSEAEYEYVARAGTTTIFPWGNDIGVGNTNCDGCGTQWSNRRTAPVGSFKPNAFGVYDMVGNVIEWVADPWNGNYKNAPADGSAWASGHREMMVIRNASWHSPTTQLRVSYRNGYGAEKKKSTIGFRVALALP